MKTLREMMDIIESAQTVAEFAPTGNYKPPIIPRDPGKEPFEDDPRSQTVAQVQKLLDAGKSVFVLLPGARGRAVGTQIRDDHSWLNVQYKGWKDPKTRSRSRLTVNLKAADDASLTLTPGSQFTDNKDRPFDYTLSGTANTSGRGLFEVELEEETQEYTVRVVDEEGSGYTVKVQAESEQQALHKAIVKVRNQYDAYPEHARIIRQNVDEEQLEETSDEAVAKIEQLFRDKQ
jgi:hypothetical protein